MHKLCNGKVPLFHNDIIDDKDKDLITRIATAKENITASLEAYRFRDAMFEIIDLARAGNKYMQEKEPWIVARQATKAGVPIPEAQEQIDNCLHLCMQLCANLAILVNPFLPFTAKKLCFMLKVVDKMLHWENAGSMKLLSVGYSLRAPELLFRKIEDAEITAQVEKLKSGLIKTNNNNAKLTPAMKQELKPIIQFDDFAKIDLKTGTIIAAEKVEKADKLLKLEVDLGFETRTIVSGIALHYTAEEIIGKQVTVVTNLAPRKMKGIESNGMILMAEDQSGKLHFIKPETTIDKGSNVS
jgi:methionyl-tRNA synthetase